MILHQIVVGSGQILATTAIHGLCTAAMLGVFRWQHLDVWALRSAFHRLLLVSGAVLLLFFAAVTEAALWAAVYFAVEAFPSFETALYFSTVTLTTLGYGDVVLSESWRLLAAFQAATGIIVFGWTTALIVALIQRVTRTGTSIPRGQP